MTINISDVRFHLKKLKIACDDIFYVDETNTHIYIKISNFTLSLIHSGGLSLSLPEMGKLLDTYFSLEEDSFERATSFDQSVIKFRPRVDIKKSYPIECILEKSH